MTTPTPALTAEYKTVIPAKFTTKRDGSAMLCMTCGTPLAMGQAFAATNAGNGGWTSYCATCAVSPTAQIAGLVNRIELLVTPLGENVPETVSLLVDAATPLVETVLGGDTTHWLNAKRILLTIREQVGEAKKAQRLSDLADIKSNDPLYQALVALRDNGSLRDAQNAQSLLDGWDKYGSLTPKQRAWAEKMTAVAAPVENGLYINPTTGTIVKVYTTQNGNTGAKTLSVVNGKGSFNYTPAGARRIADGLADGSVRKLTQAEATEFGKLHGFCVNCARDLDDERSLAVGYGPVCANHFGWFYPSKAEAAEMLARPQGLLFAPPAGPAVALPAPGLDAESAKARKARINAERQAILDEWHLAYEADEAAKAQRIAEATFRDNIRQEGDAAYEAERRWRQEYQDRHGRAENE